MVNRIVRTHRLARALQATVTAAPEESSPVGGSQPSEAPIAADAAPDTSFSLPAGDGASGGDPYGASEDERSAADLAGDERQPFGGVLPPVSGVGSTEVGTEETDLEDEDEDEDEDEEHDED